MKEPVASQSICPLCYMPQSEQGSLHENWCPRVKKMNQGKFVKTNIIESPLIQAIERKFKLPFGWELILRRTVKTKHEWVHPFQMQVRSVEDKKSVMQRLGCDPVNEFDIKEINL